MKTLLLIVITALLSACGVAQKAVQAPKIDIQSVQLQRLSLQEGTAILEMNLHNPNGFALPIRGLSYGLSLNGKAVANGQRSSLKTVAAGETTRLSVPVTIKLLELAALLPELLQSDSANYNLNGQLALPLISVPFNHQGQVRLGR